MWRFIGIGSWIDPLLQFKYNGHFLEGSMKKAIVLLAALVLYGCQSSSSKSSQQFYNQHLLFDLDQEITRHPCKVKGTIPVWLSGTLLRNGPAKFQVGNQRVSWFDGLAMLHAFEFNSEQVLYSNRFLRSEQYYIMTVEKSLNFSGFAEDPCPKVFKNQTSRFIPQDMKDVQNADVSIQEYADKMVALTEVPLPVIFDPETVATLGNFEYADQLPKSKIWESAHPQHDLPSKETINYLVNFGRVSSYEIWKMADHQSNREIVAEIPVERPAYMHSFALTEHYVVLVEFPFVVNPLDLMLRKKPFIFNYHWKPELGTQFLVVERSSGKLVAKLKGAPFFAFHHVSAYDKEGSIYLDIVTYPNADVIALVDGTLKKKTKSSEQTKLERFTIDVDKQELRQETIFSQKLEMPRVAADRTAHEYRYCYAIDASFPTSVKDTRPLYKIDVANKTSQSWSEVGCLPGEPIFVPNPQGQSEDDGVVLSLVLDFAHHRSFLLMLNARNWTEMARAEAPHAIPVGIHGFWKQKK
jgi:beta,beta-carotene 9',10'-dioxygenase